MKDNWTIAHDHHLIVVTLSGVVSRAGIEDCLSKMDSAGVDAYRRILDLSYASLDLTLDDTRALLRRLTDGGPARGPARPRRGASAGGRAGRARAPADRAGRRRQAGPAVQVFAASDGARDWLASLARPGGTH